jgi:excisionase family DNA binding protein
MTTSTGPDLDRLFLTVPEVACILRTDPRTVRRAIEAGEIPAVRVSNVVRIPTQAFRARCQLEPDATEECVEAGLQLVPEVERAPPEPAA